MTSENGDTMEPGKRIAYERKATSLGFRAAPMANFTVWFRPPFSSDAFGLGRVAVFVQAANLAMAVHIALRSGVYAYAEQQDSKAYVFDEVEYGFAR